MTTTATTLPQFTRDHIRSGYTNSEIFDMAYGRWPRVNIRNIDATRHLLRKKEPETLTNRHAHTMRLRRINRGETPTEHARMMILNGSPNVEVMDDLRRVFPSRRIDRYFVGKIRHDLRKRNPFVLTNEDARNAAGVGRGRSPTQQAYILIEQGLTNAEVDAELARLYPDRTLVKNFASHVRYKLSLRKAGIPSNYELKRKRREEEQKKKEEEGRQDGTKTK